MKLIKMIIIGLMAPAMLIAVPVKRYSSFFLIQDYYVNKLIKATASGNIEYVQKELDNGLDVNSQFVGYKLDSNTSWPNNSTLLHIAVSMRQIKMVDFLLHNNANPFITNRFNRTPFDINEGLLKSSNQKNERLEIKNLLQTRMNEIKRNSK